MKTWIKKNPGKNLWEMHTHSDFAWACFVMKNMMLKWEQDWKYHEDNENTTEADKRTFLQYKDLTKEHLDADENLCKETWQEFRAVKPLFTSAKVKKRFSESITMDGKAYYFKKYKLSMDIRKLATGSTHKEYLSEALYNAEEKHDLTNRIVRRKSKKSSEEACGDDEDSDGSTAVASPNCVMYMDGDEGHDDFVEDMIAKCTRVEGV